MQCRAIPYEGNEPYIFFSYSHKDAPRVYPLLEQMVKDGYRVWYDDGNHAGDDWLENIGQHLNNCTVCLAMLSENSEKSHNCKKEVSFAVQCNKKLMAVMLEEFAMTVGMRLQLSTIHYLKKNEYPSDTALLQKLYETEGMKACRGTPGSMPMRDVAQQEPCPEERKEPNLALNGFLKSEIANKEPVAEPEQVQPEEPVQKKRVKRKVHAVVKVIPKTAPAEAVPEQPKAEEPVTPETETPEQPKAEEPASPEPEESREAVAEEPGEVVAETEPDCNAGPEEIVDVERVIIASAPEQPEPEQAETPDEESSEENIAAPGLEDDEPSQETTISAGENEDALLVRVSTGEVHSIVSALTRIGRSAKKCDFAISKNPLVSNYHADVIYYQDAYYLKDAGSSNGTFLRDERLAADKQVQLANMSLFRLSDEKLFILFGEQAARCKKTGRVAFLINNETKTVRLLEDSPFFLDRSHKWEDGTFSNGKISREHAVIRKENGRYMLTDLNSKNGTYHNDSRIPANEPVELRDRDVIRLADSVLEIGILSL